MFTFRSYAWWLAGPALALIALFALYPVVHTLALSLLDYDLRRRTSGFAGLANYAAVLSDARTWAALGNTFLFAAVSVAGELLLGLALALALHRAFPGRGAARALAIIPWAIPAVVAGLLWRWIFNDRFGLLNELLLRTGLIGSPAAFLSSPALARLAVIVTEIWKTTPFMAILLLAGLQTIPHELHESAMVDGAGPVARFRYITLPLLLPAAVVALIFRTMDALRIFDTVYMLTGGGPGNATETISLFTYKTMFSHLDLGAGSALAVLTFAAVACVSLGYALVLKRVSR